LQYLPAPQLASSVQVPPGPPLLGSHAPFVQVKPAAHGAASQLERHWPSAQIFPASHSLENLQVFFASVQEPATQAWPVVQSVVTVASVQGQGPALPPHALHALATHALPGPQSAFVVQSFLPPGSIDGGEQSPFLQISPLAQGTASEQVVAQPVAVQTWPGSQLLAPLQALCVGGVTLAQPYASQL
jgi:hypothetical protein